MTSSYLPVITLAAGALLGFLSTLAITSMRHRQEITLRLLDQFFDVRREVVEAVSDLTHLNTLQSIDEDALSGYKESTSKLFYKHYDFLPRAVLDALLLLHVSLFDLEGNLYTIRDESIEPMVASEVVDFIEACSLYRNAKLVSPLALRSKNPTVRFNQAIKLHARHVLYTLNKFTSIEDLLFMAKRLKKAASL